MPPYFRSFGRRHPVRRRRKTEEPHDESLRQRIEQRRVRPAELLLHEGAARLAVAIGNRHAARIVDQDADEILLRHRRLQDQRRPEQAEEQQRQRGEPQADERDAVAPALDGCQAAIGQQCCDRHPGGRRNDQQDRARQPPGEVALLEHQWRVLEQETEKRFHR